MTYAIIGFGKVGQALATAFARKGIEVMVASRRPPEALAEQATAIGPQVIAKPMAEAVLADVVLLAVPFQGHPDVANRRSTWAGTTVVDVTNAYGVPVDDLDGRRPRRWWPARFPVGGWSRPSTTWGLRSLPPIRLWAAGVA